ncbi:hypothetical protein K2173_010445 [Erythroxylum novogranatense]|uniref:Uncharacterized protein n=1 Tax=Erythroxylum novogranatense TaxID=1862640 RepID=A0AAV8TFG3_9ROSI|nr:hypothetical protein K2173_010445 [Erythroxylum novogranatense]
MVQQTIDSNFSEYGLANGGTNLPSHDMQYTVTVKKTALRDVQNEIRAPNSTGNSLLLKDKKSSMESIKVSGTKRPSPEDPINPLQCQSPIGNSANAHLVYVRRKSEAEISKNPASDCKSINAECPNSRQLDQESSHPKTTIKDPKFSCFPAFSPIPVASPVSASVKPSVPLPPGQSSMRFALVESSYHPVASAINKLNNPKGVNNLHWEERFFQLQMLLKKLDESDQQDYVQMLRSLSSAELSRHAVELENRSIQLSLEEAKEVQRVGVLNVLGKSLKNFKVT